MSRITYEGSLMEQAVFRKRAAIIFCGDFLFHLDPDAATRYWASLLPSEREHYSTTFDRLARQLKKGGEAPPADPRPVEERK